MRPTVILSLLLLLSFSSSCQSLTIDDLKKILLNDIDPVERYLLSKSFTLNTIMDGDVKHPIKVYNKGLTESIYVGGGFYRKNGTFLPNITYMSQNTEYMVDMILKIVAAGYKPTERKKEGEWNETAFFEDDLYKVMLSLAYTRGENCALIIMIK